MGFFSWKTQDTNESIANRHSNKPTFTVYMTDNNGNKWKEKDYDGYGVFGGKDYYQLLAEMNDLEVTGDTEKDRLAGIDLAFSGRPCLYPNLTESEKREWEDKEPETCEDQGYFYGF